MQISPPSSAPDPNKTSVGCKDETAQRGYFQQVDCFVAIAWLVPVLLLCCGSWRLRLWLLSLLLVLVAVVVGRSELELEHGPPPLISPLVADPNSNSNSNRSTPPRLDNCVVDPNSNSNRSPPPGSIIVCRSELELELEPVRPPRLDNCVSIRTRTRTGPPPPAR